MAEAKSSEKAKKSADRAAALAAHLISSSAWRRSIEACHGGIALWRSVASLMARSEWLIGASAR